MSADFEDYVEDDEVDWADDSGDYADILGFDFMEEDGVDRSGLRALINSALVSHRRLPMLDVVFDRTARRMTTSLRQLTDENVEVALDDVTSTRFGDFIAGLSTPTVVGVVYSEFFDNYCLVAADATLVSSIVDLLLGGRRGAGVLSIGDRGFTAIELSLAERMLALLVGDLEDAFKPVAETALKLDRIETTPRFAAIAQDASVCALAKFRISIDDLGGRAAVIFPHATLEPVRRELSREFLGEGHGADSAWRDHLVKEVSEARVRVRAVLADKEMTLGAVKGLSRGDTLVFSASASRHVDLRCGDALIASGRIGRSGDRIAVKLTDAAAAPDPTAVPAAEEAGS
ncbi:MAG: FliM/FliN family flagellar motor switch protein [Pseudomonadota bacterium]